ncbi:DUF2637 domain-containing protein [Streptomyces sp. ISL-112]|uniref:DUF2637 domain-containing protein n=1 Tax=unclassified Streptomyces TaxID=2593676 RepID=UPI001BE92BBA|nr:MULTISPECIES: DUF2637 domain-containing protein [unclassified Streptomyces]MBT2428485.1 DUF2637 domain-containing protein [Streptomyces sp. ISL-112]MBT2465228.1 DUF2637 domain-containing protein [Streptomyces sp. ISL-63]
MAAIPLTRTHRILIGIVVAGAVVIAAIGFAGSYAAVRELAEAKGFGRFSLVFPIGIDAGICVLLALDLLLTWMRIPFPLLRQTAWLLTAATIAFNGAASWPDPLGTAMHAVIPVLFVVSVEAARHAVGRIADITADKHMEGVRLTRWLLSPIPTFKLWRRMKLWELRSYEQVIKLEQERLIYQARLQARFGRNWRRKAPVESMMPLRLAKYGVPLAETAPAGLAAAGIEPALLPPAPKAELPYGPRRVPDLEQSQEHGYEQGREEQAPQQEQAQQHPQQQQQQQQQPMSLQKQEPQQQLQAQAQPPEQTPQVPPTHDSPWFAAQKLPEGPHASAYDPQHAEGLEPTPAAVPLGPGRTRPLGNVGTIGAVPHSRREAPEAVRQEPVQQAADEEPPAVPAPGPEDAPQLEEWSQEDNDFADRAYEEFSAYTDQEGQYPNIETLDIHLADRRNVHHPRSAELLQQLMPQFKDLYVERVTADQSA